MRFTSAAMLLLLTSSGCTDRVIAARERLAADDTFVPSEAGSDDSGRENPRDDPAEPIHDFASSTSTLVTFGSLPSDDLDTTSSSTTGAPDTTSFSSVSSTTLVLDTDGPTEVEEIPWIGDILETPDLPLPEPIDPGCARVHWLPRRGDFAALSTDGSTVVGTNDADRGIRLHDRHNRFVRLSSTTRAFIWREGQLHHLEAGTVGVDVDDADSTDAALWHPPAAPVVVLPDVAATALTGDGATIVGNRKEDEIINETRTVRSDHAFRWSVDQGLELAPFARRLEDQEIAAQPWASHVASRDASVVAGSRSMILYQCTVCPQPQAIVWDGPTIRYATESQQIAAISRDGSTVVGHTAVYPRPHHAMRWVLEQDHMEELDLSGFELDRAIDPNLTEYSTVATDVSRDGTWILAETVLWRLDAPPVPITDLLEASCIDPDDWIPGATWFGVRISLEGRALVGCARRNGEDLCWIATNVPFDAFEGS